MPDYDVIQGYIYSFPPLVRYLINIDSVRLCFVCSSEALSLFFFLLY